MSYMALMRSAQGIRRLNAVTPEDHALALREAYDTPDVPAPAPADPDVDWEGRPHAMSLAEVRRWAESSAIDSRRKRDDGAERRARRRLLLIRVGLPALTAAPFLAALIR